MKSLFKFCIALFFATLAACDQQATIAKLVPASEMAFAKAIFAGLAARQYEMLESHIAPNLKPELDPATLEKIASAFPAEKPSNVEPLAANVLVSEKVRTIYNLTFRYNYAQSTLLANIVFETHGADRIVTSLHVYPHAEALQKVNAFTFHEKGWLHYLVFAIAVECRFS